MSPLKPEGITPEGLAAKLVLDKFGDFIEAKAHDLTTEELKWWVEQRLTGHDQVIPLEAWRGEHSADAVVDLYRAVTNQEFRTRMADALRSLAREWLTHAWARDNPQAASELLDVMDRVRPDDFTIELMGLAQRRELEGIVWGNAELHERLLLALASLQRQLPPDFWPEQLKVPRFARAAYLGLCQMDPTEAMRRFRDFLDAVSADHDPVTQIEYPLFFLIDHFKRHVVLTKLGEIMNGADRGRRELVDQALRRLGSSLDEAHEATLVNPAIEQYAEYLMSGQRRRAGASFALLEPTLLIRSADDSPQIVLEGAFKRYNALWALFPTIDSTSQALHCLSAVESERVIAWRREHGGALLRFLNNCVGSDGVAISPSRPEDLSLYAMLNALGVVKALAWIPQNEPLAEHWQVAAGAAGNETLATLRDAALRLLDECIRQGVFVDDPKNDHPSINAIDLGVSILWNLKIKPEDVGLREANVHAFLKRCRAETTGGGIGFRTHPASRREPCATSTSLACRIFGRAGWEFPSADRKHLVIFFRSMQVLEPGDEYGGFRVFASERATLSSTVFSLHALLELEVDTSDREFRMAAILEFTRKCRRDGGYAFHPDKGFSANIHATCYATRIYRRMHEALPEPDAIARYVESRFDPDKGGFYGYERPFARSDSASVS